MVMEAGSSTKSLGDENPGQTRGRKYMTTSTSTTSDIYAHSEDPWITGSMAPAPEVPSIPHFLGQTCRRKRHSLPDLRFIRGEFRNPGSCWAVFSSALVARVKYPGMPPSSYSLVFLHVLSLAAALCLTILATVDLGVLSVSRFRVTATWRTIDHV